MAHETEVKFGDLQKEQRYRKLERTLKLAFLRQGDAGMMSSRETSIAPTWPSLSSINPDSCDPNTSLKSLQSYKLGSEVISSSNNLRSLLVKEKSAHFNQEVITTSSVKRYPLKQSNVNDCDIMPPPSTPSIPRLCKKMIDGHDNRSKTNSQDFVSLPCDTVTQKAIDTNMEIHQMHSAGNSLNNTSKDSSSKTIRIFSKWRVMLNEQGQLIIKGTLECGKVARSKSVIRRLTATSVQSIYKHIYYLQGNIVDDRHELPEYVHGKFYSGFPDDWENVYQIWRTYVTQGCPLTFRWPCPIADSDDDLKSEVTDCTLLFGKSNKMKLARSESLDRSCTSVLSTAPSAVPSTMPSTVLPTVPPTVAPTVTSTAPATDTLSHHPCNRASTNFENGKKHCCCGSEREENSQSVNASIVSKDTHTFAENNESRNTSKSSSNKENVRLLEHSYKSNINKQTNKLRDIIQEDKLDIIIDNLTDKNCPKEYIDKVIEMFDCMNYVVSYRSAAESECDITRSTIQTRSKSHSNNEKRITEEEKLRTQKQKDIGHTYSKDETSPSTVSKERESQCKKNRKDSDSSESETYVGVPKIPVAKLLQKRTVNARPYKRRKRRKLTTTEPPQRAQEVQNIQQSAEKSLNYESGISVTEDEKEPNDVAKQVNKEGNSAGSYKTSSYKHTPYKEQNKNIRPFQNFSLEQMGETATAQPLNRSTASVDNNNVKPQTKSARSEIMSDQQDNSMKHQREKISYEITEKTQAVDSWQNANQKAKPVVINCVSRNMNIRQMYKQSESQNCHASDVSFIESGDTNSRKLDDGAQNSTDCTKRFVNSSPICNKSAADKKQNIVNERNHKIVTKSPSSTKEINCKEPDLESKAKLLSAWVPQVIRRLESDNKLGLIFEGKLLNEAGHIMHRKFSTGIVHRRLSSDLIETEDNEVYRLVGNMRDVKHNVPKELVKHCLYGCPLKIDQFCRMWDNIQEGAKSKGEDKFNDTTMDSLSVPLSSRGRRILPPLNYWNGERVTLKDNNLVYSPGNSQEQSSSTYDSSKKNSDESKMEIRSAKSKQTNNTTTSTKKKSEPKKATSTIKEKLSSSPEDERYRKTQRKSAANNLKKIAQQLVYSSLSESPEDESAKNSKRSMETRLGSKLRQNRSSLKKRRKIESKDEQSPERNTRNSSPRKSHHGITYTYYRGVPTKDNILSDDLASEF